MLSRILCALVAGLVMLTKTEAQGLAIHGLSPQLRATLGSMTGNRPVILARANYAVYSNVPGGTIAVMTYSFPPMTLVPGNQIRVSVGGSAQNNTGANLQIGAYVQASQGSNLSGPIFGNTAIAPNTGVQRFAWRSEIFMSVGVPGANNAQYVPSINTNAVTKGNTYSSGLQPIQSIYLMGYGGTLITDNSTSGGTSSGGVLRNSAAPQGSRYSAKDNPSIFDANYPIVLQVVISDLSPIANAEIEVMAGVMEGL
jgi:hypothetical protein